MNNKGHTSSDTTFGQRIQAQRVKKGHSQRSLAQLVGVHHTYLSKLENNSSAYPPKVAVIRQLAQHLKLDATELSYLAGRIPPEDAKVVAELAKLYQKKLPVLLRALKNKRLVGKILKEL
ncbi:Helix-turn-helix domain protein [Synechococcus sp. PCC 7335]|uniref:helix-turn-helix domain-containing protein n=1 Tax=Synechococcus sp. (strain ATCC 29403 / PCC 7335) TaxID=91464 RepID=UPI00017EC810|nr:helix-turn-helix transcriptional regulator [Synechococcus sp. PCC 7335]EDX82792.1 Helix-turn-helix domain protein [Synechococcus sp. PCC 7335]